MAAFILENNLSTTSMILMTQVTMRKVSPVSFMTIPVSNHKRYDVFSNPVYFHIANYHTNHFSLFHTTLINAHPLFSNKHPTLHLLPLQVQIRKLRLRLQPRQHLHVLLDRRCILHRNLDQFVILRLVHTTPHDSPSLPLSQINSLRQRQVGLQQRDRDSHALLDGLRHLHLVHPDATAALARQLRVATVLSLLRGLLAGVVPDLLLLLPHDADAQSHGVCAAHAPDAVNVLLHAVRQRHVDHERQLLHVDAARSHVRANQNARGAVLERLFLTHSPLSLPTRSAETPCRACPRGRSRDTVRPSPGDAAR